MAKKVMILVGAGQIGLACTRRLGYGMKIVVGDRSLQNAREICSILNNAGFDAVAVEMDLSSRKSILSLIAEAQKYGGITMLINAAGVSPSQASIETILKVDLYGTAVLLEEVGKVIANWRLRHHHLQSVRTSYAGFDSGRGQTIGNYTHRRTALIGVAAARKHQGYAARLSDGEALQCEACDGGGGEMGTARCSN